MNDFEALSKLEEISEQLTAWGRVEDIEQIHMDADELLLSILEQEGFPMTVKRFRDMEKWYA